MSLFCPDFSLIQEKARTCIGSILHQQAISTADSYLECELPDQALPVIPCPQRVDGRYTQEYLDNLQRFDDRSWFFQTAFPALSYAYRFTGDPRYLECFIKCVKSCFLNPRFGPPYAEFDHCSSRLCRSLSIAASWLEKALPVAIQQQIEDRLMEEVNGFILKYDRAGDLYPIGPNDHQGKDLAGAGIASLYLMKRHPEYEQAYQRFLYLFREKFIPESASDGGGWIDGYDLLFYELMDDALFKSAVKDEGGPDISADQRLVKVCDHILPALPVHKQPGASFFAYTHGMFYLACTYHREDLQYLAVKFTEEGNSDPRFAPYSLYFYDPSLPVSEPQFDAHIARDFGLMRLGTGFSENNVYAFLRSGPTEAFCRNNQNGFTITAFGKQILGNVWMPGVGYKKLWDTVYHDGLWTSKCANTLLINGECQLRNRYGEDWAPIVHFHRPNRPKWGDPDAWWFDFEEPKQPLGRALCAIEHKGFSVMSGSADHAYGTAVSRYTRHMIKFEDNLILILDLLQLTAPSTVSFRACTDYEMHPFGSNVSIKAGDVSAQIAFSENSRISIDRWPFQPDFGYYLTAEYDFEAGDQMLACAVWPTCTDTPSLRISVSVVDGMYHVQAGEHMLTLPRSLYEGGEKITLLR